MKFWTRGQVEGLLESAADGEDGTARIVPFAHEVVPRRLGPVQVPAPAG